MPILALFTPLFRVAARVLWTFHVHGADRVPATGPVLLAGNHVSYLDWLALWAACPRRLTFVMWAGHAKKWWLRPFLWFARNRLIVVPASGPHATADALDTLEPAAARAALAEVDRTLREQVLPHERTDESDLYPSLARLLGGQDPMGSMSRTHREIHHLCRLFGRLVADGTADGPSADERRDLRRVRRQQNEPQIALVGRIGKQRLARA